LSEELMNQLEQHWAEFYTQNKTIHINIGKNTHVTLTNIALFYMNVSSMDKHVVYIINN